MYKISKEQLNEITNVILSGIYPNLTVGQINGLIGRLNQLEDIQEDAKETGTEVKKRG